MPLHSHSPNLPFSISTMPLYSSPEPIIDSDQYYLPGGDLYILVQNTMFRIHRYFFMRNSALFRAQIEHCKAYIDDPTQTGTTHSDAIMFFNNFYTTPCTFTCFLSIIYNPTYSLYDRYTQQDWNDILVIATTWGFREIARIALNNIPAYEEQAIHIPSPTDTEVIGSSEDYDDMYVDKNRSASEPLSISLPFVLREDPTNHAIQLHYADDHGI